MAAIEGKVDDKISGDASDLYMNFACHFCVEMFRLGPAIGRKPELMFDLPNVGNMGDIL